MYSDILEGRKRLGPYPMEKLKRVDKPTTKITGEIKRFDERNHGFARAYRGDLGENKNERRGDIFKAGTPFPHYLAL